MSRTWGRVGPSLLDGFEDHTLFGAPGDLVTRLQAYRAAGVEHLTVRLVAPPDEIGEHLDVFAREVMPQVRV
jgi:hypothetical protein